MDEMVSKFNNHLKNVLTRALCVAVEKNDENIQPTHLLWALATEEGSVAAEVLKKAGAKKEYFEDFSESEFEMADDLLQHNPKTAVPVLSESSKRVIEKAVLTANVYEHKYIGTEHLLSGLVQEPSSEILRYFEKAQIDTKIIIRNLNTVFQASSSFPELPDKSALSTPALPDWDQLPFDLDDPFGEKPDESKTPALDFFSEELTTEEILNKVNPIIGREHEIQRMMKILSRKSKNNPILVGEPGVGKTAIVEGLAKKIVEGNTADILADKRIFRLDLTAMVAGTMYRGEFESRLRQLVEEVTERPEIILFIDEAHTLMGAGSASGSLDAANILKPALARGDIRCIGATTPTEFKKTIETDGALERRFQSIKVSEPSLEETRKILYGVRGFYEKHHRVSYSDEAIEAALDLSDRYMSGKFFPDKAIDLLDEAGAGANIKRKSSKNQSELQKKRIALRHVRDKKRQAVLDEQFDNASQLKTEEDTLIADINALNSTKRNNTYVKIGVKEMQNVASEMTDIPLKTLSLDEQRKLKNLEGELEKSIIGQSHVLSMVANTIRRAKLGIAQIDRPQASFLFMGPSGVGKTELAKTLSKTLFDTSESFLRLDMSEYSEGFSISKLIGAPAGYVGYREGTKLTDFVKNNPYCVILFDELEKAHSDVQNLLLQILDDGSLTDATGKKITFRHSIIIMSTNVGSERFERGRVGFNEKTDEVKKIRNQDLRELLEDRFKRELVNRIDHICIFEQLSADALAAIARKQLFELKDRLNRHKTDLLFSDAVLKHIAGKASAKLGAREIQRIIQEQIEHPLAQALLDSTAVKKAFKLKATKDGHLHIEKA
ncbi:MAG: ATP-dependent Clp protease ATP-binding subunit [Candidatus Uhrbacteria bacterium]|nr:ATP-dependent Clp protease ATP-binding subunit [Candidatus Uhrbacteria bacterium]